MRGGARQARRKGGISNGWGGREGGRESGDKWRLDPTRLRNSTQRADRRTEVGSEERRTPRESESCSRRRLLCDAMNCKCAAYAATPSSDPMASHSSNILPKAVHIRLRCTHWAGAGDIFNSDGVSLGFLLEGKVARCSCSSHLEFWSKEP